jgi:altronate hydrolase
MKRRVDAIVLQPADTVAVASRNLAAGERISVGGAELVIADRIPLGHKIALRSSAAGEPVIKFGQTIGFATEAISAGSWVHAHNLTAGEFARDTSCGGPPATVSGPTSIAGRTFLGYRRTSGQAGTRNYLAIVSSVNCSASVSKFVAQRFPREALRPFPNVDGVVALTHKGGCAMQYDGEDHRQLARTLSGFVKHPNVGGCLLIGLGCETGSLDYLEAKGGWSRQRSAPGTVPTLVMQELGGTAKTVDAAVRQVSELLPRVDDVKRVPIPAAELILGTNCGGSDGHSGVTANPALGIASDLLVACGGATVLAETTEIYGAEHLLARRAISPAVGEKLLERIRWWERHVAGFGVRIDNNPSPGNKAGGLTTIYEKSLGAIAKAGSTPLRDVVLYAEPVRSRGFVFMDTPGLDNVSVTGLVAGGCQVIAFTTGRGSCFGCKPAPSIKIATNTPMYERMIDDMDFNAGVVLEGVPLEEVGTRLFEVILGVASGRKTKSELQGLGDEEFAPWSIGPTL